MPKLKEKIKDLQTQYGLSEDAAKAVLALHDGDLAEAQSMVAEEQNKVVKWNQWYAENAPQISASLAELEQLRAFKTQVESAGIKVESPAAPAAPAKPNADNDFDPNALEQRIYTNFSNVQKDIYNIQRYHMQHYKELPDLEPIETLINNKKVTPWAAYQEWVAPMEKERVETEMRAQITKELTEKMQAEATRSGINSHLLRTHSATTGEEVTSPLDEVVREKAAQDTAARKPGEEPNDLELMADFVGTMRQGRAGLAH